MPAVFPSTSSSLSTHLLHLDIVKLALPRQPLPQLVQGDVAVAVAVKRLEQLVQAVDLLVAADGHSRHITQVCWCGGG